MSHSAQAENDNLEAASTEEMAEAEAEAETESLTAAELAIENVPDADEAELSELEADELDEDQAAKEKQFNGQKWIALACVAMVGAEITYFMKKGAGAFQLAVPAAAPATEGNTEAVATVLFSQYLLPFEIASILLLVAVVGSVVMAKKRI